MAILEPFYGLRPPKELAQKIASRPYDVLDSQEAAQEAGSNPYSLLHITKPEIDCPPGTKDYEPIAYKMAKENFELFQKKQYLIPDPKKCLYIYSLTMNGRVQSGIVGCAGIEDYTEGRIKKHELTRRDKEEDRMNHVRVTNANMEPVFFAYRSHEGLKKIRNDFTTQNLPEYDFLAEDGIRHQFWVISDKDIIQKIVDVFSKIPSTYVADGHHRTAAAALVGLEKKLKNPTHTGKEEYNYFLAVHFPDDELIIMDYNRLIRDLNGLSETTFLEKIQKSFHVECVGEKEFKPGKLHEFGMYLDKKWYRLQALPGVCRDDDPIGILDVTVLSENILGPILDIIDLRSDKRIDFVGGIRGLGELKRRVDAGEMKVGFALFPVSMEQLLTIADSGAIMPPKSTWFEPKLRSGLVVHSLSETGPL